MNKTRIKILILFCSVVILYGIKVLFFYSSPVIKTEFKSDQYVYDNCEIIDQGNIFKINELCAELKKESGVSFIIVTVETVGDIEPEVYTEEIMKDPKISRNNEKVLLFYSKEQEIITIKYDICLQYILNEKTCNDIIDNYFILNMKNAEIEIDKNIKDKIAVDIKKNPIIGIAFYETSKALYDVLHAKFIQRNLIADQINNEKEVSKPAAKKTFFIPKLILFVILIVFIFLMIMKIKEMHCPKCHNVLQISLKIIQKVSSNSHGLNEKIYKCKNCGYVKRKKQIVFPRKYRSVFNKSSKNRV